MGDVTHIGFKYKLGDSFKTEVVIDNVENEEEIVHVSVPALDEHIGYLELSFDEFLDVFDPERKKERLLAQKEYIEEQLLELEFLEK